MVHQGPRCASTPLILKLDLLQHTGSFKPRGAFTNLLQRMVPDAVSLQRRGATMVQPSPMPPSDSATALAAGHPVDAKAGGIAADSLAPRRVGELMFPLAQRHVDRVLLVSDDAIIRAPEGLWRVPRVVAEPGGAAAFAALLSGLYQPDPGERVGVVLCGGNSTAVSFGT